MSLLAGDIGGTHARLAIFESVEGKLRPIRQQTFASADYSGLEDILGRFLADNVQSIDAACFGVAGPVTETGVLTSNLPWSVGRESLRNLLRVQNLELLNDLEAAAYGIDELKADDLFTIRAGTQLSGNRAVISAGTGLGEAFLVRWSRAPYPARASNSFVPVATEGGHGDFAPSTAAEIDLLDFLARRFGHVSWERAVSGQGIANLYRFFQDREPVAETEELTSALSLRDPTPTIITAALEHRHRNCERALALFVRLLAREAGNLALRTLAVDGVYLGGGIVPRILPLLNDGTFAHEFVSKGRMTALLEQVPIHVILRDDVGLLGAARFALLQSTERVVREIRPARVLEA